MMESEFRTPTRCSIPTRPESNGESRRRVLSRVTSARRPLQTPQPVHQRLILMYGLEDSLGDVDAKLERKHRHPACGCGPTPRRISPSDRTRDTQLVEATTRTAASRCDQHDGEGDHRADDECDHKGLPPTPAGSSFGHLCISNRHATLPPILSLVHIGPLRGISIVP